MADQIVPQGVDGSPIRRSEPRPAGTSGEPSRVGPPHDAVPEFIESGVTGDRQSRRYAHTMRRDGVSGPVRTGDAVSAPVRASDAMSAPVRVDAPAAPAAGHDTNRKSAPLDSTALYRKRTNPTLPAVSSDMIAGAQPVTDTPEVDAAVDAAIDAAMGVRPPPGPDDVPSDLPSVMLDAPASPGRGMRPLALPRPPMQVILSIIAAALVVAGLWMLRLAF
jgi:hypothetical protein